MAKDRSKQILREIQLLREELTARLDALESKLDGAPELESPEIVAAPVEPEVVDASDIQEVAAPAAPVEAPVASKAGRVSVTVQPLHDLSLARVVEDALARTDGVEEATLRELRGDSATIDTTVAEGVSLVTSLRRKLPVAFDVTDSSEDSVTIALAQPSAKRESGVAAPSGL